MLKDVQITKWVACFTLVFTSVLSACNSNPNSIQNEMGNVNLRPYTTDIIQASSLDAFGNKLSFNDPNEAAKLNNSIVYASGVKTKKIIGDFKTKFTTGDNGKVNNIKLASKSIDETIVKPNEEFSYNSALGPTTKNNGYQIARVFKDGEDSKNYGGGVCQVSSTLYNAVLEAGLEVTERHPHSKPVKYVAENKDAATSYGVIDFKFKNNRKSSVRVNSYIYENYVIVELHEI